jgi:hypothetical protein
MHATCYTAMSQIKKYQKSKVPKGTWCWLDDDHHHPMHIACSALASSAVHACSARRNEVGLPAYMPKTVVAFTEAYLSHLAYNTCMIEHDERARPVSGRLWIMQFWRPDAVMLAGGADIALHWVFWLLLRFHVYGGRSYHLSVLCTAPKVCLRTNLGSRFIVCGFSSDSSWMLRPCFMKESIWHQIQMKTEDTTTKHAA